MHPHFNTDILSLPFTLTFVKASSYIAFITDTIHSSTPRYLGAHLPMHHAPDQMLSPNQQKPSTGYFLNLIENLTNSERDSLDTLNDMFNVYLAEQIGAGRTGQAEVAVGKSDFGSQDQEVGGSRCDARRYHWKGPPS